MNIFIIFHCIFISFFNSTKQISVRQLLGRKGSSVNFLWQLEPKPIAGEGVVIHVNTTDAIRNVFGFTGSDAVISNFYGNRIHSYSNSNNGIVNFTLDNVHTSDAGLYNAIYSGKTYAGQYLVIPDTPRTPVITTADDPVLFNILKLNCSSSSTTVILNGKLIMMFEWRMDDILIPFDHRFKNISSELTIAPVKLSEHNKKMTCRSYEQSDIMSAFSHPYIIDVKHGPLDVKLSTTDTAFLMKKGSTLTNISCMASCNPSCSYSWHSSKHMIKDGETGSFVIQNLTKNDAGYFYCVASNAYGNKSSGKIQIEVWDLSLPKSVICDRNHTIYIECKIESEYSKINFLPWDHYQNSIYMRQIEGVPFSSANLNVLSIQNCDYFDTGEYFCKAKLSWIVSTNISKGLSLKIYGPPLVHKASVNETGINHIIDILFFSSPKLKFTELRKDNKTLTNSAKYKIATKEECITQKVFGKEVTSTGFQSRLAIYNITEDDYGVYTFVIRNSHGSVNYQFFLDRSVPAELSIYIFSTAFGIVVVLIIIFAMLISIRFCLRKQKKKTSRIALQKIRERMSELEKNRQTYNDDDYEHYQSIAELSEPVSSERNEDNGFSERSVSSNGSDHVQPNENMEAEQDSSYEDLRQVINPPEYNTMQDGVKTEKGPKTAVSDSDSQLADDEISSSCSDQNPTDGRPDSLSDNESYIEPIQVTWND